MGDFKNPIQMLDFYQHIWAKLEKIKTDVPALDENPKSFFNNTKQHEAYNSYAAYFNVGGEYYDPRMHGSYKPKLKEIHEAIFREEENKVIPVLSSLVYGRPCLKFYDETPSRFNLRSETKEFFSPSGASLTPELELSHIPRKSDL